jgi:ribosome assembly protein 1
VDFTSEVCSALRVSDGAILVVDVIEGVCIQTRAVLRAAWRERLKVVLVLNKMDKLIEKLQLDPTQAWLHIRKVLESVNQLVGSLQAEDEFKNLEFKETTTSTTITDEDIVVHHDNDNDNHNHNNNSNSNINTNNDNVQSEAYFSPKRGNVVFASALHGWGFRIDHFADIYAKRLGVRRALLYQTLWGDYYLHPKTRKVHTKPPTSNAVPMFVQFVLKNVWDVYSAVHTRDSLKLEKIVNTLGLNVPPRDLKSEDTSVVVQAIMSKWLPLSRAVLGKSGVM